MRYYSMPLITPYPLCNVLNALGALAVLAAAIPPTDEYVPLCVLIAAALLGLSMVLYSRYERKKNAVLPIVAVRAEIIENREDESWEDFNSGYTKVVRYFTTYRTESGETIQLETNAADQNRYVTGTWGTLRYRGNQYLSFMERDIFMSDAD